MDAMSKAIFVGFELLLLGMLVAGTVITLGFPWPGSLMALLPGGGCVLIGMMIFDMLRH